MAKKPVKAKDTGVGSLARERVVTLGGREFRVTALSMRAAREWRQQFGEPLNVIIGVLQNAGEIELTSVTDVASLLNEMGGLLLGSVDILVEAMFRYSPALQKEREWIEENADDIEAMAALWEVLQLAYPFSGILERLNSGAGTNGTS